MSDDLSQSATASPSAEASAPSGATAKPRGPDRPRAGGRAFELVVGFGVLLISMVSLFVAVSANRTQERMLAASVWPSLLFGTSSVSVEGKPQVTFDLINRGTGPARIRWAELSIDGTGFHDTAELLRLCCNETAEVSIFSSGLHRRVLGSDEWIAVVRLPREGNSEALWQAFESARHRIRLRACYCSVLDDCWLLDSELDDPQPVRACPTAPPVLWGS